MQHAWRVTCSGVTRRQSISTSSSPSPRRASPFLYSLPQSTLTRLHARLVDLFSTPDLVPNFISIRRYLLTYYSLLQSTGLSHAELAALPLPETLDPNRPIALPSRLFALSLLVRDSLALAVRLPFFAAPLLLHTPAYLFARVGARLAEDEEETQAQNKVVFGLLLLLLIYPATFFFIWALLWYTPMGALAAATLVVLFANYHNKLINGGFSSYMLQCE